MPHAHKTYNIQYRIQNTETHVHKITYVPVFFIRRLYLLILMRPIEGMGPENLDLFWVQMALASLASISGPTPCNGSQNVFARNKIITSRAI
jgi:hypothetical protein